VPKILVPVDGSDNSKRALEEAVSMAKSKGASVTIVHVIDLPPTVYVESQKLLDQLMTRFREESARVLGEYKTIAEKQGARTEIVVMEGDPAENIVRYATRKNFDMIVMGSRGLGRLKEMVLGSTSRKVLNGAKCPVLIVK
jgi:nucleotide-binding universal stress UspA family protein